MNSMSWLHAQANGFSLNRLLWTARPCSHSLREALPAARLRGFTAVMNSTTNVILEAMETGRSFEEGVKAAQELGVAETDPSS
jgi:homoserine dehydrogenase